MTFFVVEMAIYILVMHYIYMVYLWQNFMIEAIFDST